ncbi:MAG: hypothetical protein ABW007_18990 [Chitinophagaceae bacterium]
MTTPSKQKIKPTWVNGKPVPRTAEEKTHIQHGTKLPMLEHDNTLFVDLISNAKGCALRIQQKGGNGPPGRIFIPVEHMSSFAGIIADTLSENKAWIEEQMPQAASVAENG